MPRRTFLFTAITAIITWLAPRRSTARAAIWRPVPNADWKHWSASLRLTYAPSAVK